jgi:hypothetical protein
MIGKTVDCALQRALQTRETVIKKEIAAAQVAVFVS